MLSLFNSPHSFNVYMFNKNLNDLGRTDVKGNGDVAS